MTRDEFREGVFKRDHHKCVICGSPAKDAHHIIERRLFTDGGYYLDNGASLCEKHHLEAESTKLSCDQIREACGITKVVLPEHLYKDLEYDKWGNIILQNGDRLKGELFYDESVQKILDKNINFVKYVKYPRTYHVPTSNLSKDDKKIQNYEHFRGKRVIVTAKMDGENTTMYNDYIHARSINSSSHESRSWVKGLWSQINYLIDDNMRLCGENLYAKHSIKYDNLESYFYLFSIWTDNICMAWDETLEYAGILGLKTVPVIYDGIFDDKKILSLFRNFDYPNRHEGYVMRIADEFSYFDFKKYVAKYVDEQFRAEVNSAHGHWISKAIIKNELA